LDFAGYPGFDKGGVDRFDGARDRQSHRQLAQLDLQQIGRRKIDRHLGFLRLLLRLQRRLFGLAC
jgi:hypothetical protein